MVSFGVPVSGLNSSTDREFYVFHSTVKRTNAFSEKVILSVAAIILVLSIVQTFWKNKRLDRLLASMNEAYSDGQFQSSQVCFRQETMTSYRFDQHFSHIPHPNRSILFIIATHIQVLILVAIGTVYIRRSELVKDCYSFHYPYEILECENQRDPCQFNDTETAPKCTYYHFELTNFITMVTTVVTWHYALRYFIVKLVRLLRWMLFRNDDQPRRMCCCCCRASPRCLRCLMYFQYIALWLCLSVTIICGFARNLSLYRASIDAFGYIWAPIVLTGERLSILSLAFIPEMIQNWLDTTSNGEVLRDLESKRLLLDNVEPLVYLINKKSDTSTSTEH